ncbi:uncharacterized protein LOC128920199 [Zeugodacus cucurbitae]|uniref:uncharacterized protein LOC128920199 n=1 Tax=Zeugodacus cucurbitae TaxID=28588 RepID=UPI0023D91A4D|nr:uncharacterized protein LOC128920199 [Zeugodacus cucurbitae]
MASFCKIFLLLSAFVMLQCVQSQSLAEFNGTVANNAEATPVASTSTTERPHTKTKNYLPLKREHWAIMCGVISLIFVLASICKYMFWPNVRICGCKQVELQRTGHVNNRELRPQYSWDESNRK